MKISFIESVGEEKYDGFYPDLNYFERNDFIRNKDATIETKKVERVGKCKGTGKLIGFKAIPDEIGIIWVPIGFSNIHGGEIYQAFIGDREAAEFLAFGGDIVNFLKYQDLFIGQNVLDAISKFVQHKIKKCYFSMNSVAGGIINPL